MQNNKVLYTAAGILIGIVAVFAIGKLSIQEAGAAPSGKQSESFASGDFIAIASSSRSDNNLLWLVDTKNRKLLLYEYYGENVVRLKCVRDIQYDVNIPDGVAMPEKGGDPEPWKVKGIYDQIRENQERLNKTPR